MAPSSTLGSPTKKLKKKTKRSSAPPHPAAAPPFTAGSVLLDTASSTLRTALPLLAIVALTQGPWAVLEASGALAGMEETESTRWSALYGLVFGVLQSGAIVWLVHGAIQGEQRGVLSCVRRAARSYFSLLGASLQAAVWTLLYLLLLVVPGILKALSYAVVLPVVLIEDRRASAALRRSAQLMDGHRVVVLLATLAVLPLVVGPWVATLLVPVLGAAPVARGAMGLAAAVLGLPFEVLGVVLYVHGARAHAQFRRDVIDDTD